MICTSLPLHVQKSVLGRLLTYRVLDLHHATVERAGFGAFWTKVRHLLVDATDAVLADTALDDGTSLNDFLHDLAAAIRAAHTAYRGANSDTACARMIGDIEQTLAQAHDAHQDILLAAFDRALQVTAEEYGRCGLAVPVDLLKRVTVGFGFQTSGLEHTLPVQLTAGTVLHRQDSHPVAEVTMTFVPSRIDSLTSFALPYVLLHECLCHALQGPWQAARVQSDANASFAEGWMDVAAYQLHKKMNKEARDRSGIDLMTIPRRDAQDEAAARTYRARHLPTPDDRASSGRAYGQRTALHLIEFLKGLGRTDEAAVSLFMKMSLEINASAVAPRAREIFLIGTAMALEREDPAAGPAQRTSAVSERSQHRVLLRAPPFVSHLTNE